MTDHLSPVVLNALVDGELSPDQWKTANQHLVECPSCTSTALHQSLLKSATAKAGQRYTPPQSLQEQLRRQIQRETSTWETPSGRDAALTHRPNAHYGWAAACALLLLCASIFIRLFIQQHSMPSPEYASLAAEVSDQHIATLAANAPPQVISSDRHTVKPWFQGKLPFSFNLPENLPAGTTLDGANLTYLGNEPTAQLLYSIGKHHVSVFVRKKTSAFPSQKSSVERAGFHVASFSTEYLEWVAISDVDPTHLSDLAGILEQAQAGAQRITK
jgi:anti-sigma factor RsiW